MGPSADIVSQERSHWTGKDTRFQEDNCSILIIAVDNGELGAAGAVDIHDALLRRASAENS